MTRQNYYASERRRAAREVERELIVHAVRQERRVQPRLGGRKLLHVMRKDLEEAGVRIGRDRLFKLLKEEDLLVPPLPKAPRTTDSRHALPVFKNEIAGREPGGPNEIWVSDITYIRTEAGFVYLSLITDRYSRKVVGYHCSGSLAASGSVKALEMALRDLPAGAHPVHHSDRGSQYCCHEYVGKLKERGLGISMTEERHCYENAHAERVNGILKQEYGLRNTFRNPAQAARAVREGVTLYNHRRPHTSLRFRVPAEVHREAA